MVIQNVGRPCFLSLQEEEAVLKTIEFMRRNGAPVDREMMVVIAKKCVSKVRGVPQEEVVDLSRHWVRVRKDLQRLRRGSTDRAPTTPHELAADQEWRTILKELLQAPLDFGLEGTHGAMPDSLVWGMAETPLVYCPTIKGTYTLAGGEERKQIYLKGLPM